MMEFEQFFLSGVPAAIDVHFAIQLKCLDQRVRHGNPSRLHWVVLVIVELADLLIKKVGNLIRHFNIISAESAKRNQNNPSK